jgi:hypothetical protein
MSLIQFLPNCFDLLSLEKPTNDMAEQTEKPQKQQNLLHNAHSVASGQDNIGIPYVYNYVKR